MTEPTLRELSQAVADAAHDYAVTAMKEDGPLADAERELADAERALGDGLDWLPQDKVSDVLAGIILAALDAERHQQTRAMIAALYWRAGRLHMQAQAMCGTPFYGSYQAEYEGVWSAAHAMERHL